MRLSYGSCGWTAAQVVELVKALPDFTRLTMLGLLNNNIVDEGAIALAKAMETNKSITMLQLGGNNIGDDGSSNRHTIS